MAIDQKGFKTSTGDFKDDLTGGVKPVGEGAAPPEFDFGWETEPEDEASFEDLWKQRETDAQTSTTGDLGMPGGRGDTDYVGGSATSGEGLVKTAMQFIGTPYAWGANGPLSFDCSGFTKYVYAQMGITLPRVSYQQGNGGQAVARDKMRPGDLVFWDINDRNNGADHVAIYIGGGKVVEALKPGTSVKVASLRGNYWARRYT